jgi:hypothetical protein
VIRNPRLGDEQSLPDAEDGKKGQGPEVVAVPEVKRGGWKNFSLFK